MVYFTYVHIHVANAEGEKIYKEAENWQICPCRIAVCVCTKSRGEKTTEIGQFLKLHFLKVLLGVFDFRDTKKNSKYQS